MVAGSDGFVGGTCMDTGRKYKRLKKILAHHGPTLVAFSGGVDSTLLALVARDVLGEKTACVLIDSPLVSRAAADAAKAIARRYTLALAIIPVPFPGEGGLAANPPDRCYRCKKVMARYLKEEARKRGFSCIADGAHLSDMEEDRPGHAATTEEGIVHPFIEAGMTKEDIRDLLRMLDLPFHDRPSDSCLATRIPYGDAITPVKLRMIEEAEAYLAGLCPGRVRVRIHGDLARIEVEKEAFPRVWEMQDEIVRNLRSPGFLYVTLDLAGYRSGSMDDVRDRTVPRGERDG